MHSTGRNLTIPIHDLSVSYNDEGAENAPAIIFIHGFPFNKSMWDGQAEALKDNYRVIAYDIRGHGDSDTGTEDFSIDLFAQDLIHLMDKLKIETAMVCGLSMGGYIALTAMEKFPGRFYALVLSDTQCTADTPEAREKRIRAMEGIKENGVQYYAEMNIKNFFSPLSFATRAKEIAAVKTMILTTSPQTLIKTLVALSDRHETCSQLSAINVPVLILAGKEDKITPPEVSLFMHKIIRNSSMYVLDHSGHLPNLENQPVFNDQLKIFADSITHTIPFPGVHDGH